MSDNPKVKLPSASALLVPMLMQYIKEECPDGSAGLGRWICKNAKNPMDQLAVMGVIMEAGAEAKAAEAELMRLNEEVIRKRTDKPLTHKLDEILRNALNQNP